MNETNKAAVRDQWQHGQPMSTPLANDRGLLPRLRQLQGMVTRKMAIAERVEYSREAIANL